MINAGGTTTAGLLDRRVPLAILPTPLVRAPRLERSLGTPPLHVKRDDLTGFALAGNKARGIELLIGDALGEGCDVLVTGGGAGSNHCRAAAAAASVAGLSCLLILYGEEPEQPHPNLGLIRSLGAEVRFTGDWDRASVDLRLDRATQELRAWGRKPYPVPRGGASPVGCIGYALAAEELAGQCARAGVEPALVVVAVGSGGTLAGLLAGTAAGGHGWRLVGAAVSRGVGESRAQVLRLADACARLLGTPSPDAGRVEIVDARGPGYGAPSAAGAEAADLVWRTEGLLLDPVFTAKAFGALIALARDGLPGPAVFLHTGGTVALPHRRPMGAAASSRSDGRARA